RGLLSVYMQVEIWSDVVCPWCYLGKRRFERALADFEHRDQVQVVHRSFELDPGAPQGVTTPTVDRLAVKYGMSPAQADQAQRQMEERAAADGLTFRMGGLQSGRSGPGLRRCQRRAGQRPLCRPRRNRREDGPGSRRDWSAAVRHRPQI